MWTLEQGRAGNQDSPLRGKDLAGKLSSRSLAQASDSQEVRAIETFVQDGTWRWGLGREGLGWS